MRSRKTRGLLLAGAALVAAGAFVALAFHPPPGPRSLARFEPDRLADLEIAMWQAYYRKEKLRVFRLLVVTLREQYRYSWARAAEAGLHLARAAAAFGEARGGYERVLPDLERAYTIARDWSSAGFDPGEVARAELEWWAARRDPARRSPADVGAGGAPPAARVLSQPPCRRRRIALSKPGSSREASAIGPPTASGQGSATRHVSAVRARLLHA